MLPTNHRRAKMSSRAGTSWSGVTTYTTVGSKWGRLPEGVARRSVEQNVAQSVLSPNIRSEI
jgi:hypothetical protein